jgi:hypothetical protein
LAVSLPLLRLDVVVSLFLRNRTYIILFKSSKRAILAMTLFPILKFASISYSVGHLCWSKSAPPPPTCRLPPPPSPPRRQWSIMMGVAITFLRLPITSYRAYTKIPKNVQPPSLLLLVLLLLLVSLTVLLCVLLALLVLLTIVTTAITLLLLLLLPPNVLTKVVLPIRISVTQFLAQATRSYLPSPIQSLISALYSLQCLFSRDGSVVAQTAPNAAPVPSIIVTPTRLPDLHPSPMSPQRRTLRRSKSWFRW